MAFFPASKLVFLVVNFSFIMIFLGGCDCTERKYLIVDQNVTFDEAVQLCLQYGMEIASPLTSEENVTLANALKAEAGISSKAG